jgi:hypothetical protein
MVIIFYENLWKNVINIKLNSIKKIKYKIK